MSVLKIGTLVRFRGGWDDVHALDPEDPVPLDVGDLGMVVEHTGHERADNVIYVYRHRALVPWADSHVKVYWKIEKVPEDAEVQ